MKTNNQELNKLFNKYKRQGYDDNTAYAKANFEYTWNKKQTEGEREITSSTYKRAMKITQKNVNSWFGRGMK